VDWKRLVQFALLGSSDLEQYAILLVRVSLGLKGLIWRLVIEICPVFIRCQLGKSFPLGDTALERLRR
jgi:hypothetical protein